MENEKNKDRMTDIQDRMNSVDVAKRKRILVIFACICVLILLLKLVVTYGRGTGKVEEPKSDNKSVEVTKSEQEQVLEFSLERKKKSEEFEDYLDKLVEEDRKKNEIKNGETE